MITARTHSARSIAFSVFLVVSLLAHRALGCDPPSTIKDATPEEIRTFFKGKKMKVLTFLGYSGAEYENGRRCLSKPRGFSISLTPRPRS
jgi:hypothetical protein